MSNLYYIQSNTGDIHNSQPINTKSIGIRNDRITLFEYDSLGAEISQINDKELKIFFNMDWAQCTNASLKILVLNFFSLYHAPNRIKFVNQSSLATVIIYANSANSYYYKNEIHLDKTETNWFVLIHEIIHACINQINNNDNHTDDYLIALCNNLLVFDGKNPGALLDINTALRLNFKHSTQFEPSHHNVMFPEIIYIYNKYIAENCELIKPPPAPIGPPFVLFFKRVLRFVKNIGKKKLQLNKKTFLYHKFASEYDYVSKIEGFTNQISKKDYIRKNITRLRYKKPCSHSNKK